MLVFVRPFYEGDHLLRRSVSRGRRCLLPHRDTLTSLLGAELDPEPLFHSVSEIRWLLAEVPASPGSYEQTCLWIAHRLAYIRRLPLLCSGMFCDPEPPSNRPACKSKSLPQRAGEGVPGLLPICPVPLGGREAQEQVSTSHTQELSIYLMSHLLLCL